MPRVVSNRQLFETLEAWISQNYPGQHASWVRIRTTAGYNIMLPITVHTTVIETRSDDVSGGRLKDLQIDILQVLGELPPNKGLSLDALAAKLDRDRSYVHRDGVKPLVKRGLIVNDSAKGGYMLTEEGADWSEE